MLDHPEYRFRIPGCPRVDGSGQTSIGRMGRPVGVCDPPDSRCLDGKVCGNGDARQGNHEGGAVEETVFPDLEQVGRKEESIMKFMESLLSPKYKGPILQLSKYTRSE